MRRPFLFALLPTFVLFAACGSDRDNSSSSAASNNTDPSQTVEATRDGGTAALGTGDGTVTLPDGTTTSVPTSDGGTEASTDNGDAPPPSGPPAVQFLGRFDTTDPAGPKAAWPGTRVLARWNGGTSLSVSMNEIDYDWEEGSPSEWDVTIDGVLQPKVVMQAGTHSYPLATNVAAGDHQVELYKRSEAQNGMTQFLGFDFGGGTLLSPPGRKTRRIEFIGDSQAAAFGIEGLNYPNNDCPGADWAAKWQNFHKSIGANLATDLNAELNGTVYSGKGIYKNIWHPDLEPMPMLFLRADPINPDSVWDFTQYTPSAVMIMMGGNDFAIGQPTDDGGPATLQQFTDAYTTFAQTIRSKYPDAHIFLIVSPSVSDAEPEGRQTRTNVMAGIDATVKARNAAGDAKVYQVIPPISTPAEIIACDGHGSPAFTQRVADQLAPLVKQATGWQ